MTSEWKESLGSLLEFFSPIYSYSYFTLLICYAILYYILLKISTLSHNIYTVFLQANEDDSTTTNVLIRI
jgi:hypothetical protein